MYWVPKSISAAERLRAAAWVYPVRRTSDVPMSHWALRSVSLAGVPEAVRARVMWQVPPGARSLVVVRPEMVQSLADSVRV